MDNNLKKFSDRKVGGKQLVVPFVAIITFILVTAGISYAYWTYSASKNAFANATVTYPTKVARSCSAGPTPNGCVLTIDYTNMTQAKKGSWNTNCTATINANVNGLVGDYVVYDVYLKFIATKSGYQATDNEFTAQLGSNAAKNLKTAYNVTGYEEYLGSVKATVATQGTAVEAKAQTKVTFYNLNKDQNSLQNTKLIAIIYNKNFTCNLP